MKYTLMVFVFIMLFFSCSKTKKEQTHTEAIKEFQYRLNIEYADKSTSPLTDEDFKTFKSLAYFPIDSTFKVVATLTYVKDAPVFEMKTTTDRLPLYKTYAIAHFTLKGRNFDIPLYESQSLLLDPRYQDYLFLPFNDLTNGKESYAGGRFLDLRYSSRDVKTIIIDFNKAYNPYCAYNPKYSCPIPPKENALDIAIPVGVKNYKQH